MSAIGPGDWVECVDQTPAFGFTNTGVVAGRIYLVTKVGDHQVYGPLLWLRDVPESAGGGYLLRRFRPIYRPKSELIEALKQPAPDAVRELEEA